jgi:glycosyltransferase involved in cell wall biosynthesis
MKILVVTNMWPINSHPYYGIFVKEQIEELKKSYEDIEIEKYFIDGKDSKWNYFFSIFCINWKILTDNFDIIHIHFGISGLFAIANPFIKIPIITTLHSGDIDLKKTNYLYFLISKLVALISKKVFVLNDNMFDVLNSIQTKLVYLPCGVNTDFFYQKENINRSSSIKIGFPGNSKRVEKNFKLFKKIIDLLELKINKHVEIVEFHNFTREQVRMNLNDISLLLMTSLSEGSPQIIKEALCCNTPIISTNVGDVKLLINGVTNCFLIDSFDENDFIEPILEIINIKSCNHRSNGRAQIEKLKLDSNSTSDKIYSIYQDVLN